MTAAEERSRRSVFVLGRGVLISRAPRSRGPRDVRPGMSAPGCPPRVVRPGLSAPGSEELHPGLYSITHKGFPDRAPPLLNPCGVPGIEPRVEALRNPG